MAATISVRVWVFAGAPGVVALTVTEDVPSGVAEEVEMLRLTETGLPLVGETEAAGANWQVAPAGRFEHARVTEPLKLPAAETEKVAGALVPPGVVVTLAGDGGPSEKSTICKVRGKSWVMLAESVPTACRLNA